jgi:hypothetical protein
MPTQYPAMINFYMIRHPDEPKFRYVGSTAHSIEDRFEEAQSGYAPRGKLQVCCDIEEIPRRTN